LIEQGVFQRFQDLTPADEMGASQFGNFLNPVLWMAQAQPAHPQNWGVLDERSLLDSSLFVTEFWKSHNIEGNSSL
jgi:hypothetical protein